jgi:hypothetical protein
MSQPRRQLLAALAASTLGAFIVVVFLLPRGEPAAYFALSVALALWTIAAVAYAYAQWETAQAPERNEALRPNVEFYTLSQYEEVVPATLLEGEASLVAIVRSNEVLHPEFAERLAPYFADSALAFVQTATHYQGEGRLADAFYAQELVSQSAEAGKNSINAAVLRGSGALVAREALRTAYRPGISFEALGLRLQAAGYSSYFETTPLVLAATPRTIAEYWPLTVRRAARALATLFPAATTAGLPLAARLQYIASAAVYSAIAATAVAFVFAPLSFVVRGVGPLIVSNIALPGLVFMLACMGIALATLSKISGTRVLAPAGLALLGTYVASYRAAESAAVRIAVGYRRVAAIVRGGGSAGTAPAGSPARS